MASDIIKWMKLFYCNIAEFGDLYGSKYLLPERRERMKRYLHPEDRARCLVAGLMLRAVLGEQYGEFLAFGSNGKPFLNNGSQFFNLSHSGDYVVMAIDKYEVGVDIERVVPYSIDIAEKCFTLEERAWLKQQDSCRAFYSLWTAKESIMKATGFGLSLLPDSFQIIPIYDGGYSVRGDTWFLSWHTLDEHEICIASKGLVGEVKLTPLMRSDLLRGE